MTSAPWLTIVTVVKDDSTGFERTVRSLAGQELVGVEYLVVDSSGDAAAIPRLLADAGVHADVTWQAPAGIYAAMNIGLASASGDYITFLNAGDEFAAATVLSDLREFVLGSQPGWFYGPVEIVGADGGTTVTPPWDYSAEAAHAFSRGRFPAHQGTVARTDLLRSIGGFDESFSIVADYAAFLRLSQVEPPAVTDVVIARFHEGGVSTSRWAESIRQFHRARRQILRPRRAVARRELAGTVRQFASMAAHRSPWPLTAVLLAMAWGLMVGTGVPWGTATLLAGFVALQGLGGAIWWRLLRPQRAVPILEAVGMGLGLGTAIAMLAGLAGAWWVAPVVALAAWIVLVRGRGKTVARLAPLQRPDLLALLVGLVPGLAAFLVAIRNYPLAWSGLWTGYHGDMPFFEALAESVARLGPGASIFMDGAQLRYHSLAYGWAGQLTLSADAAPFVVMTRLLPLVSLVAAIALAAAWTRRLTPVWWAPALAVGLVVTGDFVGATFGSVLNFDSPSQSMGAVWILALSPLLIQALDRVSLTWHALAVAVLVVALTGGKVSTAAIAAGGFAAVVLVGLVRRSPWRWRALLVGIVGLTALLATYVWLLAGSANAGGLGLFTLLDRASSVQSLNPVITPRGIVAGIVLLMLAVFPRWAGLAWLVGDRATRWEPQTAYGVGLALGGLATIAFLSGGFNDLWFAVAASAPLAVLSAAGVASAVLWFGPGARRRVLGAGLAGLLGSLVVASIWATGSTGVIGQGWRWVGPLVAVGLAMVAGLLLARGTQRPFLPSALAFAIVALVAMAVPSRVVYAVATPLARPYEGSFSSVLFTPQEDFIAAIDTIRPIGWTDSQSAAGAWLREHARADDLVATNITGGALVPALTRLTTYISDIPLQAPYGRVADLPTITEREAASWAFIDAPSDATVAPLCRAGVDWVWINPARTAQRDWLPYATVAYSSPDVTVLQLSASACG